MSCKSIVSEEAIGNALSMSDYQPFHVGRDTFETRMLTSCASSDRCYVRETTGLALPMGIWNNGHEYSSDFAFFAKDKKKPHLTCIISDTEISPKKILRSEIHGIFNLVMYRMAFKGFSDHRIKPVRPS